METIRQNTIRNGNFTSSEIAALIKLGSRTMTEIELAAYKEQNPKGRKTTIESFPGEAASTYINECNMERRLNRSITDESSARPLSWGKLLERFSFEELGLEYIHNSQETKMHPTIQFWCGSSDGKKLDGTVVEQKCPMTLKSFCQLVDPVAVDGLEGLEAMNAIRFGYVNKYGVEIPKHKDGEKYFWQMVSNSIIEECDFAELVVFVPYLSQLEDVREYAKNIDVVDQYKFFWIANANDEELPHIVDGGFYKNLYKIRFKVPEEDKLLLKLRVLQGGKLLINRP